jgi:hypothetical protein
LTRLRRAAAAELHGDNAAKKVTLSWLQGSLTGDEFEALNHWVTLLRAVLDLQQKQHQQPQPQQAPDAALPHQQQDQPAGAHPAAATEESGQQQLPQQQQPAGAQAAQQEAGSIPGPAAAAAAAGGGGMTDKELLAWLRQPGNEKHHLRVMLECLKEIGATDVPARVLLGHKVGADTAGTLLALCC